VSTLRRVEGEEHTAFQRRRQGVGLQEMWVSHLRRREGAVMTPLSLDEIVQMCEKATPGPWTYYQRGCHELGYDLDEPPNGPPNGIRGCFKEAEDAEFIASAREQLPRLAKVLQTIVSDAKKHCPAAWREQADVRASCDECHLNRAHLACLSLRIAQALREAGLQP
jgi:hypothetical protein